MADDEQTWLDWLEQPLTLQAVAELLRDQRSQTLAIKRIANARVEKDVQTLVALENSDGKGTVDDLKERLKSLQPRGINPQKLWSAGEELGYRVDVSWTACRSDGSYDVVFQRMGADGKSAGRTIEWPAPESASDNLERYANTPGRAVQRQRLADQLLDYCKSRLPNELSPESLILLDALPLAVDGKLDRQALLKVDEACV